MEQYHTVFVGFPNWWNSLPMPVVTFLENCKLDGKKIVPFVTSEGSEWGSTLSEVKKICKGSTFGEGLSLQGSKVSASKNEVIKWAKSQV